VRSSTIAIWACPALVAVAAVGLLVRPIHLRAGKAPSPLPTATGIVYRPGGPVPASAPATVRLLVSGSSSQQRAALSPGLAAVLPVGTLFPAGSTLDVDRMGWRQTGGYADMTGRLHEPDSETQRVEIGFVEQAADRWLVTFEEVVR
jgi:hypothetical protein